MIPSTSTTNFPRSGKLLNGNASLDNLFSPTNMPSDLFLNIAATMIHAIEVIGLEKLPIV
jgi:hypothetical protein